jgi:murein L,D-transpeptidase YafK
MKNVRLLEMKRQIVPLCLVLPLLLWSCSVQNSGSFVDSSQGKEKSDQGAGSTGVIAVSSGTSSRGFKADYLKLSQAIHHPSVSIQKDKRRLYVFQMDTLVREYPIGLGSNPAGDKQRDGDGKTPEGEFYICGKKETEGTKKYLIISYPNRKHVERAQFQGVLSPLAVQAIVSSLEKRVQPPGDTALGGNICIQGGGAHQDWTDGSVALYDSDMSELYAIADLGTRVYVRP